MSYRSIKSKIMLPLVISLCVIFVFIQVTSTYLLYKEDKEDRLQHIQILNIAIASTLQAAIAFEDRDTAQELINTFAADKNILQVRLTVKDGDLFSEYRRDKHIQFNDNDFTPYFSIGYLYAEDYLHVFTPVKLNNEQIGLLHVISENKFLQQIVRQAIQVGLMVLFLLLGISFYLYKSLNQLIIQPVANLKHVMSGYLKNKTKIELIKINHNDELGDLVRGFNTMLAKLASRDKQIASTLSRLEDEKSFAEDLIESVQHGLFLVDNLGIIVHHNASAKELFDGKPMHDRSIYELFDGNDHERLQYAIEDRQHLQAHNFFIEAHTAAEKILSVSSTAQNKVGAILFSIDDITDSYHANYRQQLAAGIFENSQDGILVLNGQGLISIANPVIESLLGYKTSDLLGRSPESLLNWSLFRTKMTKIVAAVDALGMWQGEILETGIDGRKISLFVKANKITLQNHPLRSDLVLIISDISNIKEVERLHYLAHHDPLTGLANRNKLISTIECYISEQRLGEFSVLFLDLDGFKAVNDDFGHDAGDHVLIVVGERLSQLVRNSDLVCRFAGDEFIIILDHVDNVTMGIKKLTQRILDVVIQPIKFGANVLQVGVSIGMHITEKDETADAETLIKKADLAMYRAKSLGKGRIVGTR